MIAFLLNKFFSVIQLRAYYARN